MKPGPMTRWRPLRVLALAFLLLTACGSGPASPTPAPPTPTTPPLPTLPPTPAPVPTPALARTEVLMVKPFAGASLAEGYSRTDSVVGSCDGPSRATPGRADAWRCTIESSKRTIDPCFAANNDPQPPVACLLQPWANGVVLFVLATPLPGGRASGDPTAPTPWGLELADGTRCLVATDGAGQIGGQPVLASCSDNTSVVGQLDRSQPIWQAQVARDSSAPPGRKAVARVWY